MSAASLALAAAANLSFFWPAIAGAAICLLIAARRFGWTVAVERVALTAIVTGFVLLAIPLSHGSSAPGISLDLPPRDSGARGLLRRISRTTPIRIGAAPEMAPVLEFYKARYRAAGWSIVSPGTPADFYLVEQAGIAVLVRPSQGGAFRPPARFLNFPNQLIPNELLFGHDVAYR